ncbi:hypothetical protein FBU30_008533 [Linnemannia zychae]|nr:hypothetical protein FBU30_008533 [Linnemannia zychae]
MAPNVLAAVDARLKESSRQQTLASQPSTSYSVYSARFQHFPNASQGSGRSSSRDFSSASSIKPTSGTSSSVTSPTPTVITHHDVLQSSEHILSREQLFDALNGDDDDNNDEYSEKLAHPSPGFIRKKRSSTSGPRSSLPRSSMSSYRSGSGIELNTKVQKHVPAKVIKRDIETGQKGYDKNNKEWTSVAMISSKDNKERYSTESRLDSPQEGTKSMALPLHRMCQVFGNSSDPDKPTTIPIITNFPSNPNLHKSFYGLDYNPAKTIMPWCGASLQEIVKDISLISQLTNRVRIYGMDCNQAELTFQAINLLNLNTTMKVVLTVWVDNNATTYQRQVQTLYKVLDTYGTSMVQGISVGNEALFRQDVTLKDLGERMAAVRSVIKSKYNANIPVFTSEIGNNLNSDLASVSDELSGNLHPYFAGIEASMAAEWTFSQYNNTIIENPTSSGLVGAISEVGWPSAPSSAINNPSAVPSVANLQKMIDTFICQANTMKLPYYWFEYKDEPWKKSPTVLVEPNWGLFDSDGNLKVKIPNCSSPY